MFHRRFILAASVLALIAGIAILGARAADNADTRGFDQSAIQGKFLAIAVSGSEESTGIFISDARVQMLGSEAFLVGTGFSLDDDWKLPVPVSSWAPIGRIESMLVFESRDDVKKFYESQEAN